ncbi:MAG: type I methionyl aminopeptidase [Kiritimatiellae bacterium]|nr:type I methionyl aminopeptidase [Kiritimatiellia bacterium]
MGKGKIPVLSGKDLEGMRRACRLSAVILKEVAEAVRPGMTTGELDRYAAERMALRGVRSTFLGYGGFPGYTCISINEEVVHGIPGDKVINEGDVVSIDLGVTAGEFTGDNAITVPVGRVAPEVLALLETTERSLRAGIAAVRPGAHVGDIGAAVQAVAEGAGYGVVRDYCGHGVGRHLHEEPQIPNFGKAGKGAVLAPGMCLAIEPMVNLGTWKVDLMRNEWTVKTRDRKPSAHFEHTVLVTEEGGEVLTVPVEPER